MPDTQDLTLDVSQSIEINSAIGDAWKALIRRLTDESSTPDNKPMPMAETGRSHSLRLPGEQWHMAFAAFRRLREARRRNAIGGSARRANEMQEVAHVKTLS